MSFSGAVGYHVHVATGETSTDYLTRTALLQALDDVLFERLGVHDDPDPSDARATVERQLREVLDLAPHTAELVADEYESNLRSLRETQAEAEVSGE
jgi:hypothetical protein